jgi:soluble lytic murein transglycosylase-like protein
VLSNAPAATATATDAASQPTDFASALQSATSADAAAADEPAVAATPSGVLGAAGYAAAEGAGMLDAAYQPETSASAGGEGGDYEALVAQAAARNGLDPAVLHGLIQQESGFDPSATSGAGAIGLTQLMPGTASSLGVANPMNPAESIEGGARYLGELMRQFAGNTSDALAAYNAGPGAVQEYGGIPPYSETQSYVSSVLANAESYRQSHLATVTGESL